MLHFSRVTYRSRRGYGDGRLSRILNKRYLDWKLQRLDRLAETQDAAAAAPPSALEGVERIDKEAWIKTAKRSFYPQSKKELEHTMNQLYSTQHLGANEEEMTFTQRMRESIDELFYQPSRRTVLEKQFLFSTSRDPPKPGNTSLHPMPGDTIPGPQQANDGTVETRSAVWTSSLPLPKSLRQLPSSTPPEFRLFADENQATGYSTTRWMELQEARLRRALLAKKEWWLRQQELPDTEKAASSIARLNSRWKQHNEALKAAGLLLHTLPPSELHDVFDPEKLSRYEEKQDKLRMGDELKRQLRLKRQQATKEFKSLQSKLNIQNSIKTANPFTQHQHLRAIRLAALIKAHLEPMLTEGTAEFLYGVMKGVHVSITGVYRETPTSQAKVYYTVLSNHSADFAQERIDLATPYLRYRLQTKLNLPRAPQLRFIRTPETATEASSHTRASLARSLRNRKPLRKPPPEAVYDFVHTVKQKSQT